MPRALEPPRASGDHDSFFSSGTLACQVGGTRCAVAGLTPSWKRPPHEAIQPRLSVNRRWCPKASNARDAIGGGAVRHPNLGPSPSLYSRPCLLYHHPILFFRRFVFLELDRFEKELGGTLRNFEREGEGNMAARIEYSEKYQDDSFEYRCVQLLRTLLCVSCSPEPHSLAAHRPGFSLFAVKEPV